jgi:hypothetical protein
MAANTPEGSVNLPRSLVSTQSQALGFGRVGRIGRGCAKSTAGATDQQSVVDQWVSDFVAQAPARLPIGACRILRDGLERARKSEGLVA